MPSNRGAETGVVIRNEFVAFALVEDGEYKPPTESEIRAWRKQYPYGSGGPPARKKPNGKLRLQIASHPWVNTRRNFHDLAGKPLEEQLNAVIVAFARMAGGLRAFSLKVALERREKLREERRRREAERRRKLLEKNVAHLEKGLDNWRWRESAMAFLAAIRVSPYRQRQRVTSVAVQSLSARVAARAFGYQPTADSLEHDLVKAQLKR
jgi:hypothetical protein